MASPYCPYVAVAHFASTNPRYLTIDFERLAGSMAKGKRFCMSCVFGAEEPGKGARGRETRVRKFHQGVVLAWFFQDTDRIWKPPECWGESTTAEAILLQVTDIWGNARIQSLFQPSPELAKGPPLGLVVPKNWGSMFVHGRGSGWLPEVAVASWWFPLQFCAAKCPTCKIISLSATAACGFFNSQQQLGAEHEKLLCALDPVRKKIAFLVGP